ncbi:MAG: hypothetical protein U0263_40845 [Polyangiaceae bacterium]
MRATWIALLALGPFVLGCGSDDGDAGTGGKGGSGGGGNGGGGGSGGSYTPETCAKDPLKTGLVAQQTGVSADVADCSILKWTAQYSEPDPMIVKAMIYGESRFDYAADGCPNLPCGAQRLERVGSALLRHDASCSARRHCRQRRFSRQRAPEPHHGPELAGFAN